MKKNLLFAVRGWAAASVTIILLGLIWPLILPGIVHGDHYYGSALSLPMVIGIVLIQLSPFALIIGVIGGNVAREGGRAEQNLMAMIFGAILALAWGIYWFWAFSGW
jgi:hypothetical protein